jgi:protein-disulfide isomerase-like protein with CxxC motif
MRTHVYMSLPGKKNPFWKFPMGQLHNVFRKHHVNGEQIVDVDVCVDVVVAAAAAAVAVNNDVDVASNVEIMVY